MSIFLKVNNMQRNTTKYINLNEYENLYGNLSVILCHDFNLQFIESQYSLTLITIAGILLIVIRRLFITV